MADPQNPPDMTRKVPAGGVFPDSSTRMPRGGSPSDGKPRIAPASQLPKFVTAVGMGSAMQLEPPFDFDGVTLRIFPLRASHYHLQRFVDRYLNHVPPQVARFRVPMSFAYLMLINYGKMAVDAANLGWISQLEILFCIPMEWYRLDAKGKYQFVDWAFLSPFIYVDNELSMTTGREVYGWPKSLAVLDAEMNNWMENPRAKPKLATASTMLFPAAYAGMRQEPRTFLEVAQSAPPSPSQVLPDMGSSFLPWVALPEAIQSSAALTKDWFSILTSMGMLRKQPYLSPSAYLGMAKKLGREINPYDPDLSFNTINLKQFRSADSPNDACYQALTNAKMELRRYKKGGLLGDDRMVFGDPSGGFRINLHSYSSTPIVDALGLEIESETKGPGGRITTHAPVLPYWLDLDMRYNRGETITWRTENSRAWNVGTGDHPKTYLRETPADARADTDRCSPYNTATGNASQEIAGPFDFPDTTMRVLPLMADPVRLEALARAYLNEPLSSERMFFKPWGRCVYMVAANHNGVSSDVNDIGWWADRDVTFYVPMLWYTVDPSSKHDPSKPPPDEALKLRSVALVPMYAYANSTTAAITSSEVSGTPVMKADVVTPPGTWMEPGGPSKSTGQPLLQVSTTVLPVLGEGQGAEKRLLLEVASGLVTPAHEVSAWRHIAETWGKTLKDDLARMWKTRVEHPHEAEAALSLSLEVLAKNVPFNIVTLKQFRDTGFPESACYQSLVLIHRQIERVLDLREIESQLHLCVHDYPTQPIVEALGLVPKHVTFGSSRAFYFEPLRPFWIRVALREALGVTVARRAGTTTWTPEPAIEEKAIAHYFLDDEGQSRVSADMATHLRPQRLRAQIDGTVAMATMPGRVEHEGQGEPMLDLASAARAIETIDPQMIVSTVLSREWENWGTSRWSQQREVLARQLAEKTRDALPEQKPSKTTEILRGWVDACDRAERDAGGSIVSRSRARADLRDALQRQSDILEKLSESQRVLAGGDDTDMRRKVLDVALIVASDVDLYQAATTALASIDAVESLDHGAAPNVASRFDELMAPKLSAESASVADRARVRAEALVTSLWSKPEEVRARLGSLLVEHITDMFSQCREALLVELSLCAQKPDFCVNPETLPTDDRDLLFPRELSWTRGLDRWFVGDVAAISARKKYVVVHPADAPMLVGMGASRSPAQKLVFDDTARATELGSIHAVTIWSGDVVDAIRASYESSTLDKHGGPGGTVHVYPFGEHDPLVAVSVHYGDYFGTEHVVGVELVARSRLSAERAAKPANAKRTVFFSAPEIAHAENAEIGAFSGASVQHSDGTVMLSRLEVTAIVPE